MLRILQFYTINRNEEDVLFMSNMFIEVALRFFQRLLCGLIPVSVLTALIYFKPEAGWVWVVCMTLILFFTLHTMDFVYGIGPEIDENEYEYPAYLLINSIPAERADDFLRELEALMEQHGGQVSVIHSKFAELPSTLKYSFVDPTDEVEESFRQALGVLTHKYAG